MFLSNYPKTFFLFSALVIGFWNGVYSQDSLIKKEKRFTIHGQLTTVTQYKPAFHALYNGDHSLVSTEEWATTLTSTFFAGVKLWKNTSFIFNPELSGGRGLSSAFGVAAFTNGESFRVGSVKPKLYIARAFLRQLFPLSKGKQLQEDDDNKIQTYIPEKFISITVGKVSIADYFDDNSFSHNPRTQFLSWGLMSNGGWDYPANTRGYTPSAIIEYVTPHLEVRGGISMMPVTANGNVMDKNVNKANASTLEVKFKYNLRKQQGKISILGFYNTGFMGSYTADNIVSVQDSIDPAIIRNDYSIVASRQYGRSKYGFGINMEQNITANVGIFARASYNDGKNETWCFTEIDRAFSAGISIQGKKWKRENDVLGFAYCVSGLSGEHRYYLANGGLGFIVGDGALNYGTENLMETYYNLSLFKGIIVPTFAYQLIVNPAYNKDRGPVNVYTFRLHFKI